MRGFNYKKKYNLILLVGVLALMGVGYAYLSTTVSFNGNAVINNASWNIYLDNVQPTAGSVTPTATATINDAKTEVTYEVTLVNPGDFYEFTVDAKNDGSIDGMIESISSKLNNKEIITLPDYLTYSISYLNGCSPDKNHILKSTKKETYKVRIEFKKDITADQLPTEKQNLNLNFSVVYNQADENGIDVESLLSYSLMSFDASDTVIADDETADHNMRYMGASPNNYVTFNGEEWRVIGVFNNIDDGTGNKKSRVKLVRNESIGNKQWHTTNTNVWKSASLMTELQSSDYASNNMVENAVWYLGDQGGFYDITAVQSYNSEKGARVAPGNDLTWTGKVALMYPSDYGFASFACKNGEKVLSSYHVKSPDCKGTDWLYSGSNEWLLIPTSFNYNARYVDSRGFVYGSDATYPVRSQFAVRPAVYLKSNVICKNCSESDAGSQTNPFELELK